MSWRDMGRTVQIRGLGDAKVILPLVIFIFFFSMTTFLISIVSIGILMVMRYKGYSFPTLIRWARSRVSGKQCAGRMTIMKRRMYDEE